VDLPVLDMSYEWNHVRRGLSRLVSASYHPVFKVTCAVTYIRISCVENKRDYQKGKRGGGINWEAGIYIYTLLYIKEITNEDLLRSMGNATQYSVMSYMGIESKKEGIYVYV